MKKGGKKLSDCSVGWKDANKESWDKKAKEWNIEAGR